MHRAWRELRQVFFLALVGWMVVACGGSGDAPSERESAQVRLVLSDDLKRLSESELEGRLRDLGIEVVSISIEGGSLIVYGRSLDGRSDEEWARGLIANSGFLQSSPVNSSLPPQSTADSGSARGLTSRAASLLPSNQLFEPVPAKWSTSIISGRNTSDSPLATCVLAYGAIQTLPSVTDFGPYSAGERKEYRSPSKPQFVYRPAFGCQYRLSGTLYKSGTYGVLVCEPYGADHIYGPDFGVSAPGICLKKVEACPVGHVADELGICRDPGLAPVEPPDDNCKGGELAEAGSRTPNPILPASGEKLFQRKDVQDASSHPLNFDLTFRTKWKMPPRAGLGSMWSHNHSDSLRIDSNDASGNSWVLQKGNGAQYRFIRFAEHLPWNNHSHASTLTPVTLVNGATGWRFTNKQTDESAVFTTPTAVSDGRLVEVVQRNGWKYEYFYNNLGYLESVVNRFGRSLSFSYHENGLLAGVTAPDGRITQYTWDADARLIGVTHPDATNVRYVYEDPGFPQFITGLFDESNRRFQSVSYDSLGRAVVSTLAGGVERYTVDYSDAISGIHTQATIRDPLGTMRTFSYAQTNGRTAVIGGSSLPGCLGEKPIARRAQNPLGLLDREIDFLGRSKSFSWDNTRMLLTSVEEAVGSPEARRTSINWHASLAVPLAVYEPTRSTTYTYDTSGRILTKKTTHLVGSSGKTQTTTYTYDAAGLLASQTEPNGARTTFLNNAQGLPEVVTNDLNQSTRIGYDGMGRVTRIEQPDGFVRTMTYNERGLLLTSTGIGGSSTLTTTYSYTPSGQIRTVTSPSGYVVTYSYDDAHRVVGWSDNRGQSVNYTLDELGNPTAEVTLDADGQVALQVSRQINVINRVESATLGTSQASSYSYDLNGQLSRIQSAVGQSITFSRDALNRVTAITNTLNQAAGLAYNGADAVIGASDSLGVRTGFALDGANQMLTETSLDSGNSSQTFDSLNLLSQRIDPASRTSNYVRDKLGRPTSITYSASGLPTIVQSITYDSCRIGKVCVIDETHNGVARTTLRYQWDAWGRMTQQTQEISSTLGSPHTSLRTSYSYVASGAGAGQIESITYPSGNVLSYGYSASGQLFELRWNGQPLVENIVYNALGQAKAWNWAFADSSSATSLAASRSYTRAGQLSSTEWGSFSYNALNQVQLVTQQQWLGSAEGGWSPQTVAHAMVYDPLDRLTGFASSDAGGSTLASYGYVYDANGNRLDHGMIVSGGTNRLARYGTELVSSNTAGDLTEFTESKLAMAYDAAARMSSTRYVPAGSSCANLLDCQVEVRHWYNALGQRTLRDGVDGQTAFVYGQEGYDVLGEYRSLGHSSEHIWLPSANGPMPVAVVIDGEHFAVHTDHLNTPRRLTDRNGVARWQWVYSGYGESSAQSLGAVVRYSLRYPGQVDDGSGLHYNWHRFYQPQTGRYTQADPIGLGGGWNRFAYVGGNPLSYSDPEGLLEQGIVDFGAGMGDVILLGQGQRLRDLFDVYGGVDQCSDEYSAGEWAGIAATAVAGGIGGARGLPAAAKQLSNPVKGRVGEALSILNNRLKGSTLVDTQTKIPGLTTIADSTWTARNGATYYVESKFGTAGLTKPQRIAQKALGGAYQVEKWTYEFVGKAGAYLGVGVGAGAGSAAASSCGCR